jgi:hypothetical protein
VGLWFLSKKNILIPNVAEKNILILVEGKKKFDSEFLSYNLILNFGKKNCTLRDKEKYIPWPRPLYPLNGIFFVFFNILYPFQFRDCEGNTLQLYCVPNSEK